MGSRLCVAKAPQKAVHRLTCLLADGQVAMGVFLCESRDGVPLIAAICGRISPDLVDAALGQVAADATAGQASTVNRNDSSEQDGRGCVA